MCKNSLKNKINNYNVCCFNSFDPPRRKLQLRKSSERRRSSWYICEKEFAPILENLRHSPLPPTQENGLIYESSGKYVWQLEFFRNGRQITTAYKTNPGTPPWRYIFNSSLTIREMRNYCRFEELNIPVAKVIAAGDERKNFILQESFIATEFLHNSRDGRVFMPGGSFREDQKRRHQFCRLNLKLLAQLHNNQIFHKAFHPRNLLWRDSTPGNDMEVFWIDVDRCRKVFPCFMRRAIIVDLHTFFRDMLLSCTETMELIQYYTTLAPQQYLPGTAEEILQQLIHFRRRAFSQKRYKIFSGE